MTAMRSAVQNFNEGSDPTAAPRGNEHQAYACIAERYKTKFCRAFMMTGRCQYESKCMFAHGGLELRNKEMNVQDGITSEAAIKAYRKQQNQLRRRAAKVERSAGSCEHVSCPPAVASAACWKLAPVQLAPPPRSSGSNSVVSSFDDSCACTARFCYSHNPYSFDDITVSHEDPQSGGGMTDALCDEDTPRSC